VPEPRPDHCEALTLLALSLHDKLDEAREVIENKHSTDVESAPTV
jgi:hypothetical protein